MATPNRVLIVDDEPIARDSLEALLFGEGYELYFAGSGSEGLAVAREVKPDAVVLDVMMPGMDGFEVCRSLRADPSLALVAIIMVTALDDRRSRLTGLSAGADEFLSKPFDSLELKIRLQTIARLGRYRRLLAEQRRLEWLVDQSEDGFLLLDNANTVDYANPRARLYLNLAGDGRGVNFLDRCARYYRMEPMTAWQTWNGPKISAGPFYLVQPETPTARAFWLQVERFDLPDVAEIGSAIRLHNVTAQMSNYQDIRRFHTTIVHKLRTPLIAMHGSFSLLKNYAADMSPAEVNEFVDAAMQGIDRLSAEIDDILGYIGASALAINGEIVTVASFAEQAKAVAAELEIAKMAVVYPPELAGRTLPLSARSLNSILWEILENSKKFHPTHTPNVTVEFAHPEPELCRLRFTDDGLNLNPEQLQWVWTPYVQAEKYFTGEAPGMGLGLPLVATLVWQVGGQARLYNSQDGPGIVVELDIPHRLLRAAALDDQKREIG